MKKYTHKKYTQSQLTKIFAQEAKLSISAWQSLKQTLWFNPTDDNSLRLSYTGYNFLRKHGYKGIEINLKPHILANKHLLMLERYYPGVYLIMPNAYKIILFDEDIASFVLLMGGNMIAYLENLEKISVDDNSII